MSYERATDDLDKVLGNVLQAATTQPEPAPQAAAEGHDPDRTVRATVTPDGRIETVEITPRAARLNSHELAERAIAAINAALDAQTADAPAPAADTALDDRLREAQDLSLRQLNEYTQSLRDLMNSFERR
ncbi:YbaB/EbfC family nucleoid-associated protein [Actinomadura soli]|uniref:YbaB/EbfC family nucleoid-associated protein n=1 Tax=Actinomadura soli TaxID=2508997 RepID=A0A5C4J7Y7_9ACTN|nr:YbaB/EbfC family nucleoid-associated protein [Actinomadura soli]TMQ94239.1 YbaB/EbfC family nucleoid-associated protein [Actinomadura soli]